MGIMKELMGNKVLLFLVEYIAVVGFVIVHISGLHDEGEDVYDDGARLISSSPAEETNDQAIA